MLSTAELLQQKQLNDMLKSLVNKCDQLKELEQKVQQFLDQHLRFQVRVVNLRSNILVLEAENAAIATRLRFLQEDLLKHLKSYGEIRQVKVLISR